MRAPFLALVLLVSLVPVTQAASSPSKTAVTGVLTVMYVDDFAGRRHEVRYFLKDNQSGKTYRVTTAQPPKTPGRSGRVVTLRGQLDNETLQLDQGLEYLLSDGGTSGATYDLSSATPVTGDQKTVVLLADFSDMPLQCSKDQVRNTVFTDPNGKSVDGMYRAASEQRVSFSGDTFGPFRIAQSSTDACDVNTYEAALEAQAKAAGIDTSAYARKVYVLPSPNQCPFAGAGTVGDTPSRAWIAQCGLIDVYAHELGHNVGMQHASTPTSEYGDLSDYMGSGYGGIRLNNAAHLDQLGWRSADRIRQVTSSGVYDVAPLPLIAAQSLTHNILKLARPGTKEFYYVSYRRRLGLDTDLQSTYKDKVSVHRAGALGSQTYLLGVLGVGQAYTDPDGTSFSVTTITTDYASVQVSVPGTVATCTRGVPTISVSPPSQKASGGSAVSYSLGVVNTDSSACPASTFGITSRLLPSGWSVAGSPASLTLSPGASGTATVNVASTSTSVAGIYSFSLGAKDSAISTHGGEAGVTYEVVAACTTQAPSIVVSPAEQSAAAGATLSYAVSVYNRDSSGCASTSFSLGTAVPSGWAGSVAASTLLLAPGATAQTSFSVISSSSAQPNKYSVSVSAVDSTNSAKAASAGGLYDVTAADGIAPTTPTGLAATLDVKRRTAKLVWAASADNVGVAGYRVWRNGIQVGQTQSTSYSDSRLTAGSTYTYSVSAYDAAGNQSGKSGSVSVTVPAKR